MTSSEIQERIDAIKADYSPQVVPSQVLPTLEVALQLALIREVLIERGIFANVSF